MPHLIRCTRCAWLVATLITGLVACTPSEPAQFAIGSRVVLVSQSNITLRRECGQLMSAVTGVVENGDEAIIRERRFCARSWWYLVEVPALRDHPLEDSGWVPQSYLKNR